MHRRQLLKAAGGAAVVAATGVVATSSPAEARTPADPFDLTRPGAPLLDRVQLHNNTVLQSFGFDNANHRVYTVQLMAGGQQLPGEGAPVKGSVRSFTGDLCLTQLDLDGNETGHMFLKGFGHGVQIGAEPVGESAFLWTEVDAVADDGVSGWGTRIARFRFDDGAVLSPDSPEVKRMQLVPGSDRTTVAVSPEGLLTMRYRIGGGFRYGLFDLDEVRRQKFVPVADVPQPSLTYSFQGYTTYGGLLYLLEGSSYGTGGSVAPIGNTYVTVVDWATGAVVDRQLVCDASELLFREPEGMAIQVPDSSRPDQVRLCFGFASTVSATNTAKLASIWYKAA